MATRRPRASRASKSRPQTPPAPMDDVIAVAPPPVVPCVSEVRVDLSPAEELAILEAGWDEPLA